MYIFRMRSSHHSSFRSILAAAALLAVALPSILLATDREDHAKAERLVRRALKTLSPPVDAVFDFTQTRRRLGHLQRPWQTYQIDVAGAFLLADSGSSFYQIDSARRGQALSSSVRFCRDTTFAIVDYGEDAPKKLTLADRRSFLYDLSALTPVFLLKDFLRHDPRTSFLRYVEGSVDSVVYRADDGRIIAIAIDPRVAEARSISMLYSVDLYGDVVTTTVFSDYHVADAGEFRYPSRIVERAFGFDANVTSIGPGRRPFDRDRVMTMIPATYQPGEERPKPVEEILRIDYNEHIHLIDMKQANTRSLVVEFRDFLLVAEAPLNTRNGEMIIGEARKIAPDKPIRYFLFGHHHPHYIGGIRAFIHKGATILVTPSDSAYVRQLSEFRHSLEPDSLEREPRPLQLELVQGERVISDGEIEMRIIHIGSMSKHTEDYLIYYFPAYKLLFQGDLVWIRNDAQSAAAGPMQRGLYEAIMVHKLDVDVIMQSWMVSSAMMKTMIGFDELQESVDQWRKEERERRGE